MKISSAKIDAQKILQGERKRTFFVSFLSILFTLTMLAAAALGIYFINMLSFYGITADNTVMLLLFYALFTVEVIISVFMLSVIGFNKKRWFFENAYHKNKISRFFGIETFRVRLKLFFIYIFKKVMNIVLLLLFEIPFFAAVGITAYYTQNGGMFKRTFILCIILSVVLFFVGLFFAMSSAQKYSLCELLIYCDKKTGIIEAVKMSKSLTDGNLVRLLNFKLSFCLWILSCLLILPSIYALPYINQSLGTLYLQFLEKYNPLKAKDYSIIFMKAEKSKA